MIVSSCRLHCRHHLNSLFEANPIKNPQYRESIKSDKIES